jgi:thioredoxin 2
MTDLKHVVCPHCDATNRLPIDRLAAGPKCGKCGKQIFAGHPVALNDASFEKHVSRSDIPVVVDFWAPWCGAELEPNVRLTKLNTEEAQNTAARFNIRSIPTLAIFRNGKEVARQAGAMGAADIVRWVEANAS